MAEKLGYTWKEDGVIWDEYTKYRPVYTNELYDLIFTHHATQGNNSWTRACDLGCGGGLVASRLLSRFDHVIASDPVESFLEDAKRNLSDAVAQDRVTFVVSKAEDLDAIPEQSLDMITMAEAIHWTDYKAVIRRCHQVLKPGGTLAVLLYGTHAHFIDSPEANGIMEEMNRVWIQVVRPAVGNETPGRVITSQLRCLPFPRGDWKKGVRRNIWLSNWSGSSPEFSPEPSNVIDDDILFEYGDDTPLVVQADLEWTKGYMHYLTPKLSINEKLGDHYTRLEKTFNGIGGSSRLAWTCNLVLATKEEVGSE